MKQPNDKPELYRPSNGTEGAAFQEHYCAKCVHDQDENNPCIIWMLAWEYDTDEPEYPKQWIWKGNIPHCTKFTPVNTKQNQ